MEIDKEKGVYIARLRDEAGLKQNELAQKITWSPSVLSRIESGERPATSDELEAILTTIGTDDALDFLKTLDRVWVQLPRPPLGHPDDLILWEAEKALLKIDARLEDDIKSSFANRLKDYRKGLEDAAHLVHNTEHSIAFVGNIGVGKSTAICRVSGLEVFNPTKNVRNPALEIGGGGVTICEVHLIQGPGYGILVEPRSVDDIHREVREFAHLLKDPSAKAQNDDVDEPAFGTSKEIERAIRNMSGLRKRPIRKTGKDGKKIRETVDEAKNLADNSSDTNAFVVEILTRMGLDRRTKREIWHTPTNPTSDPLLWIKENFERVNNGRHPEFSIPKRIEISVPEPILGEKSLSISMVDTKGIDRTAARADIENLFGEPNTIVVLCSSFNDTPSSAVQLLLERAIHGRFPRVQSKTILLGLPRAGEALAVKDDDGFAATSIEDGYDLKREQAETRLQAISAPDVRIDFFNAFDDAVDDFCETLIDQVNKLRDQHRDDLKEAIDDVVALIDNFEQAQVLAVQEEAARRLKIWLQNNSELDLISVYGPERGLLDAIDIAHASSVRASVRRQGEWDNLDYSHELSTGARRAAADAVGGKLKDIQVIIDNMLDDPELTDAYGLIRQARRVVRDGTELLLNKSRVAGGEIHALYMQPAQSLWDRCDTEWGQGPGYRNRVVQKHKSWFYNDSSYDDKAILALIGNEWEGIRRRLSLILDEASSDTQ